MGKQDKDKERLKRIRRILRDPFAEYPGLTERERLIAGYAARGKTIREIATKLSMSEKTVGTILFRLRPRLGMTKPEMVQFLVARIEGVLE